MTRRVVALVLWTYFGWYLAATLASFTGAPTALGPIAAIATLAFGALGWLRSRRSETAPAPRSTAHAIR